MPQGSCITTFEGPNLALQVGIYNSLNILTINIYALLNISTILDYILKRPGRSFQHSYNELWWSNTLNLKSYCRFTYIYPTRHIHFWQNMTLTFFYCPSCNMKGLQLRVTSKFFMNKEILRLLTLHQILIHTTVMRQRLKIYPLSQKNQTTGFSSLWKNCCLAFHPTMFIEDFAHYCLSGSIWLI